MRQRPEQLPRTPDNERERGASENDFNERLVGVVRRIGETIRRTGVSLGLIEGRTAEVKAEGARQEFKDSRERLGRKNRIINNRYLALMAAAATALSVVGAESPVRASETADTGETPIALRTPETGVAEAPEQIKPTISRAEALSIAEDLVNSARRLAPETPEQVTQDPEELEGNILADKLLEKFKDPSFGRQDADKFIDDYLEKAKKTSGLSEKWTYAAMTERLANLAAHIEATDPARAAKMYNVAGKSALEFDVLMTHDPEAALGSVETYLREYPRDKSDNTFELYADHVRNLFSGVDDAADRHMTSDPGVLLAAEESFAASARRLPQEQREALRRQMTDYLSRLETGLTQMKDLFRENWTDDLGRMNAEKETELRGHGNYVETVRRMAEVLGQ